MGLFPTPLALHSWSCNANNSASEDVRAVETRCTLSSFTRAASAKRRTYISHSRSNGRRLTNDRIASPSPPLSLLSSTNLPPSPPYPFAAICTNDRTVLWRAACRIPHRLHRTLCGRTAGRAANANPAVICVRKKRGWEEKLTKAIFSYLEKRQIDFSPPLAKASRCLILEWLTVENNRLLMNRASNEKGNGWQNPRLISFGLYLDGILTWSSYSCENTYILRNWKDVINDNASSMFWDWENSFHI